MISIAASPARGSPSQRSLSGRHGNTTRFVIGFLIVNVIARQLDQRMPTSWANWMALRIISSPCAAPRHLRCPTGNDDGQKGTWRHTHAGFNNRIHQRQTLLAAQSRRDRRSSVSSTDISTKSSPTFLPVAGVPASTPRRGALFIDAKRDLFGQHIRSLAPQLAMERLN